MTSGFLIDRTGVNRWGTVLVHMLAVARSSCWAGTEQRTTSCASG